MIKNKTQISNIEINGQTEQVEVAPIQYSKYNPKISPKFTYLPALSNTWWNVYKYSLAILLAVFCILSLYFASVWQARHSSEEGKLDQYMGVLEQLKMTSRTAWSFGELEVMTDYTIYVNSLNGFLGNAKIGSNAAKSLFDLVPFFNASMLSTLMAFSVIGLIWVIPVLLFKNQTRCSTGAMFGGLVIAIIVIALFSTGMHAQNTILMPFKDIQSTISKINAYEAANNSAYVDQIAELKAHLHIAFQNLISVLGA